MPDISFVFEFPPEPAGVELSHGLLAYSSTNDNKVVLEIPPGTTTSEVLTAPVGSLLEWAFSYIDLNGAESFASNGSQLMVVPGDVTLKVDDPDSKAVARKPLVKSFNV